MMTEQVEVREYAPAHAEAQEVLARADSPTSRADQAVLLSTASAASTEEQAVPICEDGMASPHVQAIPTCEDDPAPVEAQAILASQGSPAHAEGSEEAKVAASHCPWHAEERRVAKSIARSLGETESRATRHILRLVHVLGHTQAQALLAQTIAIEEHGGMLVSNGSRRRTRGGVFFHLAHTIGVPKPGLVLPRRAVSTWKEQKQKRRAAREAAPPFPWDKRMAIFTDIGTESGTATTAKITVIGRFSQNVPKQRYVIGLIEHHPQKRPSLPWGLPVPEEIPTRYVIAIAASQWKSVAETMSDPEDAFIIEGYAQLNFKLGAISVYAESITTKKAQEARRQSQQQG